MTMFWLFLVVLILWPAGSFQQNRYSTTIQRSSDVTIHSTTRKQNLTINYKVCLNWKPYHIKATAQPKYNTGYEKFNVTVVQINFYNAVLELERIDQDSGWGEMLFTVQWAIYHVSDYITSTATVQYRVDYDTDVKISGTSNVSAVYGEGLSPLPALQNNSLFQPRLSQERQNGHRFLVFDRNFNNLITSLDLNPKNGENDLVTVFIVYRRDILISNSPTSNGLFGADDNDWDKLILLTSDKLYVAGTVNINIAISSFPTNANPIAFNIWNVISVQWNLNGGVDASSVWCNGKLLQRFQAELSPSDTRFAMGNIGPNGDHNFRGAIGEFVLFKGTVITDYEMKKYQLHFIEKWGIIADPIPL